MFDHVPPPAVPSYNAMGSLAGGATLKLDECIFRSCSRASSRRRHDHGTVRPWGLGRGPMTVISPWSKGGWVNSQTFDHTSVGQFLEKRFGVTIPGISPGIARCAATCCGVQFRFAHDPVRRFLPGPKGSAALVHQAEAAAPGPNRPPRRKKPFQEAGSRLSRALPYVLHADACRTAPRSMSPSAMTARPVRCSGL